MPSDAPTSTAAAAVPLRPRRPAPAIASWGPSASTLLAVVVALACVLLGFAMGRATRPAPPKVHCATTLHVESVGPAEWTLTCETP